MNKLVGKLALACCFFSLIACGGHADLKPTVLADADFYTQDGLQAYAEADWQSAEILFSKALSLQQSIDNLQGVLFSHINLAEVALATKDFSALSFHLDRAHEIAETDALVDQQPRITLLYALAALKQGKVASAKKHLQTILPAFQALFPVVNPNAVQLAAIATRTRIAFINRQDEKKWSQRFANALNHSSIERPAMQARLLRFQAERLKQQDDFITAKTYLLQALAVYKRIQFRSGIAATLSEMGQLYSDQKQWLNARDAYKRALAVFYFVKDKDKILLINQKLGKLPLNAVN